MTTTINILSCPHCGLDVAVGGLFGAIAHETSCAREYGEPEDTLYLIDRVRYEEVEVENGA